MNNPILPRLGAACGGVFAVALFVASGHLYVVGLAAIVLFVPFLAYLCSLLREAEGPGGWLSATALAAGLMGITIKALSVVPEIANRHVSDGTALHRALQGVADAATVVSLYPFAVLLAAVAVLALRTGMLPRWLGIGAAATAIALAVNGSFIDANFVPALLLFVLWTLVASVVLFRRAQGETAQVVRAHPTAAG